MSEQNNTFEEQNTFGSEYDIEKAKDPKKTAIRLSGYLFREKWKLLLVMLGIGANALFEILSPWVLGVAINEIYEGVKRSAETGVPFRVSFETMGTVLSVLLGLYVLQSVFSFAQQRTMTTISQGITLTRRRQISEKLTKLPLRYFDSHPKGEILSHVTNDIEPG